jgi:hypothetical protein
MTDDLQPIDSKFTQGAQPDDIRDALEMHWGCIKLTGSEQEEQMTDMEQGIQVENAGETIAALVGYFTNRILDEEERPQPDQRKIAAYDAFIRELREEQLALCRENQALVDKACHVYGHFARLIFEAAA